MAEQKTVKRPVKIMETVLRDAHQSLIATRMTTEQMLPIIDKMDKVGYNAVGIDIANNLKGYLDDKKEVKIVAYFNTRKKNPKEPDIRVYDIDSEGKQGIEVAVLWENISKNENRY